MDGIFCSNFYSKLANFHPCRHMWCSKCYTSARLPKFHIASLRPDKEEEASGWKPIHLDPQDYLHARNGNHTLVPFEWDLCIFRKLRRHDPDHKNETDSLLLSLIRRANLDAFWSSSTNTVGGQRNRIKMGIRFSESLGLLGPYTQVGHLPPYDHCGYEVACQMSLHSLRTERNDPNYILNGIPFVNYGLASQTRLDHLVKQIFPHSPSTTIWETTNKLVRMFVAPFGLPNFELDVKIEWGNIKKGIRLSRFPCF